MEEKCIFKQEHTHPRIVVNIIVIVVVIVQIAKKHIIEQR